MGKVLLFAYFPGGMSCSKGAGGGGGTLITGTPKSPGSAPDLHPLHNCLVILFWNTVTDYAYALKRKILHAMIRIYLTLHVLFSTGTTRTRRRGTEKKDPIVCVHIPMHRVPFQRQAADGPDEAQHENNQNSTRPNLAEIPG